VRLLFFVPPAVAAGFVAGYGACWHSSRWEVAEARDRARAEAGPALIHRAFLRDENARLSAEVLDLKAALDAAVRSDLDRRPDPLPRIAPPWPPLPTE